MTILYYVLYIIDDPKNKVNSSYIFCFIIYLNLAKV